MNPKIQNPYLNALIPIGGVVLLGIFTSILTWGLAAFDVIEMPVFWISLIISGFFCLIWLIILFLGARKVKKIRRFLASDRPLIRWTYSTVEWKRIKELDWNEQRQDWKLQWGCMGLLIAAAGGLTGAMLGLGEGFGLILVNTSWIACGCCYRFAPGSSGCREITEFLAGLPEKERSGCLRIWRDLYRL